MISQFPVNFLRFLLILLFQVLFFSNVHLHPLIEILIYPLFILLLPFETPRWLMMLLGFFLGISIDFFLGTLGMHAAVSVLLAFIRPDIISLITPKGADFELSPNIYIQGFGWFFIYSVISYIICIGLYLVVENGSFHNLFMLLLKIIVSVFLSVVVSMVLLFILTPNKKRRHVG